MKAPDERTKKAINAIRFDEQFVVFRKWLESEQVENDLALRHTKPETLGYYQGISFTLEKIISAIGQRE